MKLVNNELEKWNNCSPLKVHFLGSKAFQQDGFPVDHEDLDMPKCVISYSVPEKPHTGALTSCHGNHDTVSAPREESKSLLLKCVIYGFQRGFQSPDSSGMSLEINSLILSGSIHLSRFFTPCFFFYFLKGTRRRRIPFKAQRHDDAGWGITSVRSLINPSDSPVLYVKTETTSHFNEGGPKDGKAQGMGGDAEHEAGEHLIPWGLREGTSLVMVTQASLCTSAMGSFRKPEFQG